MVFRKEKEGRIETLIITLREYDITETRRVHALKYTRKYRKSRKFFFFFYKIYFEGTSRFKMKNSFTACSSVDDLKNVIYSSKCVPHKAKPFASLDFIFI